MKLVGQTIQWGNRNLRLPRAGDTVSSGERGGDDDGAAAADDALFAFPELLPSDDHKLITAPFMVFDSFDCWHGAATWADEASFLKSLRDIDPTGRKGFQVARKSIEMRFR